VTKSTAVIYARVSTARQAEEELPVESQVDRCREKAAQLGASVDRVFVDEGISGTTDNRPAFRDCIAYCDIAAPQYLITWSTSRFARNKVDAGLYKLRLGRMGVEIVYVSQSFDRGTDAGWMTESVLELFDEFYSRQVSADTIRSMVKNARDGHWNGGRTPFGYQSVSAEDNPKRKRLVVDPTEAIIVRDIFRMRALGYGAQTIGVTLNDQGHLNRGRRWNKTTIAALLRNDTVRGCIVFGKRERGTRRRKPRKDWIIVLAHEPIIDAVLWNQVQSLMDEATAESNTGSPLSTYLFTGILRCQDGTSMQIESAKGRNKRYWYYNCRSAQKAGGEPRRIPARDLDAWLVDHILDRILTPENLIGLAHDLNEACGNWAKAHERQLRDIEEALAVLQRRNEKIFELFELYGKETPNLGDLTRRLRANNKKIKAFENQLQSLGAKRPPEISVSDVPVAELADALRYIIETSEEPRKLRGFFSSFIRAIWVEDDAVRIEYHPEVLVTNQKPLAVPSRLRWLPEPDLLGTRVLIVALPDRFRKRGRGFGKANA